MKSDTKSKDNDVQHLDLLCGITFRPVFIMGDHRSGTTLLYQLLDAAGCFNVVSAYHIIRYDEVLTHYLNRREADAKQQLGEFFKELGVTDRLLDGVQVSPDLPEEYGFLLEQNLQPQLTSENLPRFDELCRKIQFVSDRGKPLLLKNPWDFTNFTYVKEVFPECRFIFLQRHPVHLVNSQVKAARQLYETKSPYHALLDRTYDRIWKQPLRLALIRFLFSSRFDLGYRIALRHVTRATRYFLDHIQPLAERDYVSLRFEDLCANPLATVRQVLRFLGIEARADLSYDGFIQARHAPLLAEVQRHESSIVERQRS